jgi:parvulin-like peptidyl-prolyl isomerase
VHIIRVVDHQAARTLPLDEIRPQLQQFIQEQKRQEQTAAFVNGLKAKSKVEIYI